jgi:hypothetical protein
VTDKTPASPWSAASGQLRETAKWIVSGSFATGAGVLAGSSLTSLGKLDPVADIERMAVAGAGGAVGILSLAILFAKASKVLTVEAASLTEIATATEKTWQAELRAKIDEKFAGRFPADAPNLASLRSKANSAVDHADLLKDIQMTLGFLRVKDMYERMMRILPICAFGALAGIGLYAWAANPGDKPITKPPGITLEIRR